LAIDTAERKSRAMNDPTLRSIVRACRIAQMIERQLAREKPPTAAQKCRHRTRLP
jgi:hypothetical protein